MLSCRMDVALHQTNRAVTQDRRQRGKVDPCLRETGCESVAEVVKDEREYHSGCCPCCANSVMRPVHSCDVLARITRRRKNPFGITRHPLGQNCSALTRQVKSASRRR